MEKLFMIDQFDNGRFNGRLLQRYDFDAGTAVFDLYLASNDLQFVKYKTFGDFRRATYLYKTATETLNELAVKIPVTHEKNPMKYINEYSQDDLFHLETIRESMDSQSQKPFYEERWFDEDLEDAIEKYGLTKEETEQLKKDVKHVFSDHSGRFEQIDICAGNIAYERERTKERDQTKEPDLMEEPVEEKAEDLISENNEFIPDDMLESAKELIEEPQEEIIHEPVNQGFQRNIDKQEAVPEPDFPDVPENGMRYSLFMVYEPKEGGRVQFDEVIKKQETNRFFDAKSCASEYLSKYPDLVKDLAHADFAVRFFEIRNDPLKETMVFNDSFSADRKELCQIAGMSDRETSELILNENTAAKEGRGNGFEPLEDGMAYNVTAAYREHGREQDVRFVAQPFMETADAISLEDFAADYIEAHPEFLTGKEEVSFTANYYPNDEKETSKPPIHSETLTLDKRTIRALSPDSDPVINETALSKTELDAMKDLEKQMDAAKMMPKSKNR